MTIVRITAEWQGFRGAPGYSNFYFDGPAAVPEEVEVQAVAIKDFFEGVASWLPDSVTIAIRATADEIDETTGSITGQVDFAAPSAISGDGSSTYSSASGAVVNWNTTAYRNGRRVRGRTFLVPLSTQAYDANGDLSTVMLNDIRPAAAGLVSNPGPTPLVVWSRPGASGPGEAHPVSSSSIPDIGAILRSRRD